MIYLKDVLSILMPNQFVIILDEADNVLYQGPIWHIDSKYVLSCPVTALSRKFNIIYITIAYD